MNLMRRKWEILRKGGPNAILAPKRTISEMKISLDWINSKLRHYGRKEKHSEFGRYINRNYPNGSRGEKKG